MNEMQQFAQQVERQRQLLHRKENLFRQLRELTDKTEQLKRQWLAEQADVEKLQKNSLTALLYDLIGKKEERLEREQQEALAAAAKYQSASAELEQVQREWQSIREELKQLQGCEARLEAARKARAAEIKAEDPQTGARLLELETRLGSIKSQKRELREAMDAGTRALQTAREIQEELDSAASWGTWDLLGGGGLLTQMAKHDHLDGAQELVQRLQWQLRQFKTELADVEIHAELDIQIDEFLRFADWFFDGLIVDWTVQKKIEQAKEDVYRASWQIQSFLNRLEHVQTDLLRREDQTKDALDAILTVV